MKKLTIVLWALVLPLVAQSQELKTSNLRIYGGMAFGTIPHADGSDRGFQAGLSVSYLIAKNVPAYLSFGAEYTRIQDDGRYPLGIFYSDVTETISSLAIPLNVSYQVVRAGSFNLEPFAGFTGRINAKCGVEGDMVKRDYEVPTFQPGWNVGLGVNWGYANISYRFNKDFTNLLKEYSGDSKVRYNFITIGVNL